MKPLSLILLLTLLISCRDKGPCSGDRPNVSVEVEAKYDLTEEYIQFQDSIALSIVFSKLLNNLYAGGQYDISEEDPVFALYIQEYSNPSGSLTAQTNAKEDFDLDFLSGGITTNPGTSPFTIPDPEEVIFIRPSFSNDQYAVNLKLHPKGKTGRFFIYWSYLSSSSIAATCLYNSQVYIINKGTSNFHFAADNAQFEDRSYLEDYRGLLFFDVYP